MSKDAVTRVICRIGGAVQGVGFRPFVYRLATQLGICGQVSNDTAGVVVEAEASRSTLDAFLKRLRADAPLAARILSCEFSFHQAAGFQDFQIQPSDGAGEKNVSPMADIATCPECRAEIHDSCARRFAYPFTNCTQCGPRFTIMTDIPYDRPNTSMHAFALCADCLAEYENSGDRRFHAQPLACPACGPRLAYCDRSGDSVDCANVLQRAADDIRSGAIVALKGLGGFHVMADARSTAAIARLRQQKLRAYKPFALMFPDMATIKRHCFVDDFEEILLSGPEAPIVLLKKRPESDLPDLLAPGNPCLGCMLPYTPLHILLLERLGTPVVATSGNLIDEPICIDEHAALRCLSFADFFLVHDRPIVRHADDSVARVIEGKAVMLRRARGYAPRSFPSSSPLPRVLAVGGDLKNAIAISRCHDIVMSQHIGDLETAEAFDAFQRVITDFRKLFSWTPEAIAADRHPGYFSSRFARTFAQSEGIPLVEVQHHHAHMAAGMFENGLAGDVLAVTWDGTGYGTDGTVWGGEFLSGSYASCERVAHLHPFSLAGADAAVREPRRSALGVLLEAGCTDGPGSACLHEMFSPEELTGMTSMIEKGFNAVRTTSAGRLFDAVSAIAGICRRSTCEGQAAMMLEFAARGELDEPYPFALYEKDGVSVLDWRPAVAAMLADRDAGLISRRFHSTLVEMIRSAARAAGVPRVILSGGVFQNALLLARTRRALLHDGFDVYTHQILPPNDGGIALGQILVAAHQRQWS
jgi:hydrogenase maturation protein HypF